MVRLEIYVSAHCFGCAEAHRLAAAAAARFDAADVRIIDIDATPEAKPESIIAVPSYALNQEVISLGNPREVDLMARIEQALVEQASGAAQLRTAPAAADGG